MGKKIRQVMTQFSTIDLAKPKADDSSMNGVEDVQVTQKEDISTYSMNQESVEKLHRYDAMESELAEKTAQVDQLVEKLNQYIEENDLLQKKLQQSDQSDDKDKEILQLKSQITQLILDKADLTFKLAEMQNKATDSKPGQPIEKSTIFIQTPKTNEKPNVCIDIGLAERTSNFGRFSNSNGYQDW